MGDKPLLHFKRSQLGIRPWMSPFANFAAHPYLRSGTDVWVFLLNLPSDLREAEDKR